MTKRTIIIISTITAAATLGIAGAVTAAQSDDSEPPITGDALTVASDAALAHTGEGEVTDTEVGDEDSYYEVEVTLDDGRQVDVQLDEDFQVVDATEDDEAGED